MRVKFASHQSNQHLKVSSTTNEGEGTNEGERNRGGVKTTPTNCHVTSTSCGVTKVKISMDANFGDAKQLDANFGDAKQLDANFGDAKQLDANFSDANFGNGNFSDAKKMSPNQRLDQDMDISNLDEEEDAISDANQLDANLAGANFTEANLEDANLTDAYTYDISESDLLQSQTITTTSFDVTLTKKDGSLGFTILKKEDGGLFVKEIIKEPAINEPLITPGDKILLVNGIDVSSLSHSGAISFLRGLPNTVTLRLEPALPFEDITKDVVIIGSIDGRRPDHAQRKGVKQLRHEARMMIKEKSTDSLSRLKQRKEKSRGRLTQAINYDVNNHTNEDANGDANQDANGDANSSYGDANSSNYSTLNRSDASRASTDCQASDSSSFASDFKETPNREAPSRETPSRETPNLEMPNEVAPKSGSDSNHRHKIVIHSSPVDLAKVNRNESIDGVPMQKIIVNHSSASLDTNLASLGTNSAPKMVSESKNPFHDSSLRTGSSDMDSVIKSSLCHNLSDDHLLAAAQNADANDSEPVASFAKWRGANLAGWDIGPPVGAVGGGGRTSDEADSGFGGDNDWTPKTTLEKPLTTQDMEAINELMNESSDDTHAQEANVSDCKLNR